MKLILTHANADFDAVAALLAAHLLDPDAVPVLPRRVNRNVAQFITLYGAKLPFIQPNDLRRGAAVEHVTVVDSQSYTTVRGMKPDTPIRFIDHHPLSRELTPHQTFTGEPVGAATTLLVEHLCESHVTLEVVEATLLMLGIYEDTGSLAYGTTTARDIHCAAWLLERGARLDVVREFLQRPLTPEQRALYDQLLARVETHTIEGHAIVIARAEIEGQVEEMATLAHRLRELLDPAGIFLLVAVNGDVQLIARGTTDAVDVSRIARRFGGGGHGRAAAALIRGRSLPTVYRAVRDALPDIVSSSVRVEALMSWGVQTVRATDRVDAAAAQMQRAGHEGYPVLEANRLVGLLTRRDVDRAMHHRLGYKTVREIMEAGQFTVRPDDSITVLQQRMMHSGWGQIPVVDHNGALLGIVTRTDLIKQWGQHPDEARRGEIVGRMRAAMPPGLWALVEAIAQQAQAQNVGLFLVGGFVRDLLLGTPNQDIDLVVEHDAIDLVRGIQAALGGDMRSHIQFVTAKWLLDDGVAEQLGVDRAAAGWPPFIDFATARTEFYEQPTALPTVERSSIKLDLHRRDFTINTLAIRLSPQPMGELLDFYEGERDLEDGIIRVLHSLSFVDDPTRILRAVRLEQRLGFEIEPRTRELIDNALPLLERLSGDRVRHELALILAELEPLPALERLAELGVLRALHPDLVVDDWVRTAFHTIRRARQAPPWPTLETFDNWMLTVFSLFTSRLPKPDLDELGRRLQFSRTYLDHLQNARAAIALLPALAEPQPASVVVELLESLDEVGWLAAWAAAPNGKARAQIENFTRQWRFVRPTLNGRDVQTLTGLPPGPAYGNILRKLRAALLDGEIAAPEDERAFVQRIAPKD